MAKFQTKFKTAEMSPGFLLWKVSNLHQRLQRKALADLDLTPSQFSILACYFFLSEKMNLVTQADVCRHASIDKMLISDLTKTLIKKHYLKKTLNKEDRRSQAIQLAELGAKRCNDALKIIEELDSKFFTTTRGSKVLMEILSELTKNEESILG